MKNERKKERLHVQIFQSQTNKSILSIKKKSNSAMAPLNATYSEVITYKHI